MITYTHILMYIFIVLIQLFMVHMDVHWKQYQDTGISCSVYTPDTVQSELVKQCTKKIAVVRYTCAVSKVGGQINKMIFYSILFYSSRQYSIRVLLLTVPARHRVCIMYSFVSKYVLWWQNTMANE